MNKKLKGLYAITDAKLMSENLLNMAEQAINGGVTILQYRNKTASITQQEQEARTLCQLCKKNNVLFIVNDDIELATKVNADGVHLGQKDTQINSARKKLGPDKIIGITCHNQIELAQQAQSQGADYIAFGRFYSSLTKPDAPAAKLSLLAEAKKTISIPIVAIGGITSDTAPELLEQGADMLAVIHGIFAQHDVFAASKQFVEVMKSIDRPRVY